MRERRFGRGSASAPRADYARRLDALSALVAEEGLDALLVTNLVNVRYLCGFTGTNGVVLVGGDRRIFCSDFRYRAQAEEQVTECEWCEADLDLDASIAGLIGEVSPARLGIDDAHLTVKRHRTLQEKTPEAVGFVPAGGLVERLRAVKDESECRAIARAAGIADEALGDLLEHGLIGHTERALARFLEDRMRDRGADGIAFPSIVAAGANGALPHAETRDTTVEAGVLVVVDFGVTVDGYNSDCTRTFAASEIPPEARDVYELVRTAQAAGVAAARAGARACDVDRAAREIISDAGHGKEFGHSLGHGVGLEVHEGPVLSSRFDARLEAGNVVTVEPGVYIEGRLGVRIEDLLVIGGDGSRNLSRHTKELETVE